MTYGTFPINQAPSGVENVFVRKFEAFAFKAQIDRVIYSYYSRVSESGPASIILATALVEQVDALRKLTIVDIENCENIESLKAEISELEKMLEPRFNETCIATIKSGCTTPYEWIAQGNSTSKCLGLVCIIPCGACSCVGAGMYASALACAPPQESMN